MSRRITRALIYTRISETESEQDVAGVSRQRRETLGKMDYWFPKGWELVHDGAADTFCDNNHSAFTDDVKPRPAFERSMKACQLGQVDAVCCWATDRLYRRPVVLERIVDVFTAADPAILFRVVISDGIIDLNSPMGQMNARTLANFNHFESQIKSERIKAQVRDSLLAGNPPATMPRYGYRRVSHGKGRGATLVIVETEAVVVRVAAGLILDGLSLAEVAAELNRRGYRRRNGAEWDGNRVEKLVKSPILTGLTVHHGEVVGEGNWEAILDRITWQRVQASLADPTRLRYRPRGVYWLRGTLVDEEGTDLKGARQAPSARGQRPGNYTRRVYRTRLTTIDAEAIERLLLNVVGDNIDAFGPAIEAATPDPDADLSAADAELRRLEGELVRVNQERARGELEPIEYQAQRIAIKEQIELVRAAAPAQPRRQLKVRTRDLATRWRRAAEDGGLTDAERQEVTRLALGRVVVGPGLRGQNATHEAALLHRLTLADDVATALG